MAIPISLSRIVLIVGAFLIPGVVSANDGRGQVSFPSFPWTGELDVPLQGGDHSRIRWGPCDSSVTSDPTLSCGFMDVPLDYHDPSAGYGHLAVIKANATGERRGTVLLNPGM